MVNEYTIWNWKNFNYFFTCFNEQMELLEKQKKDEHLINVLQITVLQSPFAVIIIDYNIFI